MKLSITCFMWIFIFLFTPATWALEDFTDGQDFFAWGWEAQLKPTIQKSYDTKGLSVLAAGLASTAIAHQYDDTVFIHNTDPDRRIFDSKTAELGGSLGSGGPGIAIALAQLFFDRENGLAHSRALALTSANHITLAAVIHRQRPNEQDYLSMPSGHASSSFATATSLAYAYGWQVGVPAYVLAGFIAATRVSENIHWTSDVVAAAALGIYWGRASALVAEDRKALQPMIFPTVRHEGASLTAVWDF